MAVGYAIHVAINRYCNSAICRVRGELLSCVEGGRMMQALARERGFVSPIEGRDNLLIDGRARLRNFEELLEAATVLQAGDYLLLTFAGHGATARRGWMLLDFDVYFGELASALLQAFRPGVRILVISNSCRSGGALEPVPPVITEEPIRSRQPVRSLTSLGGKPAGRHRPITLMAKHDGVAPSIVHLAGCKANELLPDTMAFTAAIDSIVRNGVRSFGELIGLLRERLAVAPELAMSGDPQFDAAVPFNLL